MRSLQIPKSQRCERPENRHTSCTTIITGQVNNCITIIAGRVNNYTAIIAGWVCNFETEIGIDATIPSTWWWNKYAAESWDGQHIKQLQIWWQTWLRK